MIHHRGASNDKLNLKLLSQGWRWLELRLGRRLWCDTLEAELSLSCAMTVCIHCTAA
jgi:hypothetical protein